VKAEVWKDAQRMSTTMLRKRHRSIGGILLDAIVREEQQRHALMPVTALSVLAATESYRDLDVIDFHFWLELRNLHANVTNVGFGEGKRRFAVFNGRELTFKRNGEMTGPAAYLLRWAHAHPNVDPEMPARIEWLKLTIDATRAHRKERRAHYAADQERNRIGPMDEVR
jgi:hypothetical protein